MGTHALTSTADVDCSAASERCLRVVHDSFDARAFLADGDGDSRTIRLREAAGRQVTALRAQGAQAAQARGMLLGAAQEIRSSEDVKAWMARAQDMLKSFDHAHATVRAAKPVADGGNGTIKTPRLQLVGRNEARPSGTPKARSASGGDDSGGSDGPPLPLPSAPCLIGAAATRITATEPAAGFTFGRLTQILSDWPASWRLAVFHALPDPYRSACWDSMRSACDSSPERDLGGAA